MEPAELIGAVLEHDDNGSNGFVSAFDTFLRPSTVIDHRGSSVRPRGSALQSDDDGPRRLLFAVFALAIREWWTWTGKIDSGDLPSGDRALFLRRNVLRVDDWLFHYAGAGYSVELAAEVFHFDVPAFRQALRRCRQLRNEARHRDLIKALRLRPDRGRPQPGVRQKRRRQR